MDFTEFYMGISRIDYHQYLIFTKLLRVLKVKSFFFHITYKFTNPLPSFTKDTINVCLTPLTVVL